MGSIMEKEKSKEEIADEASSMLDTMLAQSNNTLIIKTFQEKLEKIDDSLRDIFSLMERRKSSIDALDYDVKAVASTVNSSYANNTSLMALFKYVIMAFVTVILILGAVIVYITQVDIDFKQMTINNKDKIETIKEVLDNGHGSK